MPSAIPLSLYVHFPWCVRKCPYCDFNSHGLRDALPEADYIDALITNLFCELEANDERRIGTVFIGGGTPSLVSPGGIGALLSAIRSSGRLRPDAEVTLEANPGATDESHYAGYLEAGVNRLSLGVQSFDDKLLRGIGRIHSARQSLRAVDIARRSGFTRINLDLMYALPEQTITQARDDIGRALEAGVEHLSIYQLTIEPNTEFAVRPPPLPNSELAWEMQEQASRLLHAAGYRQYEVSAWTRLAPCEHNLNYWHFGDYLAIGAGAHGKLSFHTTGGELGIVRYWNHRHPGDYLAARRTREYRGGQHQIPGKDIAFEFLMNALRLCEGFTLREFTSRTGLPPERLVEDLAPLFERKWLLREGEGVRPSDTGFRFLDSLLLECMVD